MSKEGLPKRVYASDAEGRRDRGKPCSKWADVVTGAEKCEN